MPVPLTINLWSVEDAQVVLQALAGLSVKDAAFKQTEGTFDSSAGQPVTCNCCGHETPDMRMHESPSVIFSIQSALKAAGIRQAPDRHVFV